MKSEKNKESKKSLTNAGKVNNSNFGVDHDFTQNEQTLSREEIPDTPFVIISSDKEHFGTLGNFRITEIYLTKEIAIEETKKITWNRIIQVISIINEIDKKTINT